MKRLLILSLFLIGGLFQVPASANSHDTSYCYEFWEEASRDGIDTMDKIQLIDMSCSKFLSADNTRWIASNKSGSSSTASSSSSNRRVWCATADDYSKTTNALCLTKGGKSFNTANAARIEHLGLKSASRTSTASSSISHYGLPSWCARDSGVTAEPINHCTSTGGKFFSNKVAAEAEHSRLKSSTSFASLTIRSNVRGDRVYIDGKYKGTTRLELDLSKGRHTIRIEKDGYKTYEEEVDLKNALTLRASLEKIAEKPVQTATTDTKALDLAFWQSIQASDDPDMYREYLRQFPEGVYAGLAKLKMKKLGGTSVAKSSIPNLDYGRYHALVIGNNDYENLPDLETAVSDARRVASILEYDYGFEVKLLKDATRDQIIKSLSGLRRKVGSEDNLLIYYAGHGNLDKKANEGYWLPTDAEREDPSNWIPNDTIVSQVRAMDAKHVMVVADSCFAGSITRGLKIEQRTPDWLQKIVKKKARTALTSGGLEPVMDSGGGNHSAFASAFISLLEENDGVLDASQLFSQLRPKVMVNSDQTPEYGDIHRAGHDGGDFLFVRQ